MDDDHSDTQPICDLEHGELEETPVKGRACGFWKWLVAGFVTLVLVLHVTRRASVFVSAAGLVQLVQGSWDDSIADCADMLQKIMAHNASMVRLGEFNFQKEKLMVNIHVKTAEQAAESLRDPDTNWVQIGNCGLQDRSVVWLYPDKSGDGFGGFQSSFLLADGECERLQTQALDERSKASCVAVYRIPDPKAGTAALNHFHGPGTISHAVVGGHGSDAMKDGVLQMSLVTDLSREDPAAVTLVDTLETKLTPHGTVFLDSCFAGINGMAEMFSKRMPQHWVMGGVVSLQSFIKVYNTPFDGSANSGPTQVTSEQALDRVIDPSKGLKDDSSGYPQAQFVQGLVLEGGGKVEKSNELMGERIVAWYGGMNRGSVTQWLYPSRNKQVLKIGCHAKVLEPFYAFRMGLGTPETMDDEENDSKEGLGIFAQLLPVGLQGKVLFLHDMGNVPTSGNALINYDLPQEFKEKDVTGGAGATLGPLFTLTTDFNKLDVSCP